ncbi:MAG TPA: 3-hydroxyacyl-CoA dehydrogenase NAD-binding domain-containing protein [Phycisphaerae bacterium]|nr:3-hydroxyacyl-CoA dehydrogenase NAD-binding domain-containing protein [Phycisphaerae bacterium]
MGSERVIGVVGCGAMGSGIAQAAATAGYRVQMLDIDSARAAQARRLIEDRLAALVPKGLMPSHVREETVARLADAAGCRSMADAECIVEAVPENLALKRQVFAELDGTVSPKALLATTASCLSIAKIAEGLRHADRVIGMHFFDPFVEKKVVELVASPSTSEQAKVDARAVCAKLGLTAVKVTDSPGFIGSRIGLPFYLESLRLLEKGEADVPTIDAAVKKVGGFAAGPFERLDSMGLDISLRLTERVYDGLGRWARYAPNAIQRELVAAGHVGRRAGRGFYDYSNGRMTLDYQRGATRAGAWKASAALAEFAEMLDAPADRAAWLYARIMLAAVNEAALVADSIALPRDVNLAMELGFDYPEGPLAVADRVGLDVVRQLLDEFAKETPGDDRYKASPLLERLVSEGHLGEKTARGFLYHAL